MSRSIDFLRTRMLQDSSRLFKNDIDIEVAATPKITNGSPSHVHTCEN
jgi:hypothetical protein